MTDWDSQKRASDTGTYETAEDSLPRPDWFVKPVRSQATDESQNQIGTDVDWQRESPAIRAAHFAGGRGQILSRRIVAYLDGLQAKVDEVRRLQAATQKELDALMPSILAKAFAGEL